MTPALHRALTRCAATGAPLGPAAALAVLRSGAEDLPDILQAAHAVRRRRFGNRVTLCSIVNAKSGACAEDCAFCAQSARHPACRVPRYRLLDQEALLAAFDRAAAQPIRHFGIVTSGGALDHGGLARIASVLAARRPGATRWCASLGCLGLAQLRTLKAAGLARYHHNLETARSFFPRICTTHTFERRVETVRAAKRAGLEVCCGGILGLGESLEQRVELARFLAELEVDQIPLNFLVPVPGTRLAARPVLPPLEALRTIAMFRLVCPRAGLGLAAGRVRLGRLQSLIFYAGCNAMMIGDLLTVAGGRVEDDLRMLADLELEPVRANPAPPARRPRRAGLSARTPPPSPQRPARR